MLSKVRNRATSIATMLAGFDNPAQTVRVFLGLNGHELVQVRTRDGRYDFEVRGRMDIWCLKETLLDDVYRKHGFAIGPAWTVIDIGAGFGDFTVVAARSAVRGRVFAFEPFPSSYQSLEDNIRRNRVANVRATRAAVTGVWQDVTLDFSSREPLHVRSGAATSTQFAEVVPSVTLERLLERDAIDRVDLLKLDCEGCEYEVLLQSPAAVIDRIERVVMEYHEPVSGMTHETLVDFLRNHGFAVQANPNPVHPKGIGYLRASRIPADLR